MSFFGDLVSAPGHLLEGAGHIGQAVGDHVSGVAHGVGDVAGGIGHGIGDVAGGYLHAGGSMASSIADGVHSGIGDLSHGNIGGAIGHVAGGIGHGIGEAAGDIGGGWMSGAGHVAGGIADGASSVAHGAMGAFHHLLEGGKDIKDGVSPIMKAKGIFDKGKSVWDILHGKADMKDWTELEKKHPNLVAGDKGGEAIKDLMGDGDKKTDGHESGVDQAVDVAKSGIGGAKSVLGLPEKMFGMKDKLGKMLEEGGKIPGAGLLEKLSGGALKESVIAEKAGSVLKPLHGFMEKGGEKLLNSPIGKILEHDAEKGLGKLAGKFGSKLVPGLNMAAAGLAAFESGKDAVNAFKKGDYAGAAIEGIHTVTNIIGGLPIPGAGLISVGGDIVAGAAHWLKDGGAKKIADVAGNVGGAIAGGAKALANGPIGQAVGGGLKAVGNIAGGAAKAIADSPVGQAVGSVAKKVIDNPVTKAVGGAVSGAAKAVGNVFKGW